MKCSQKGHENQLLEFLCMNDQCTSSSLCCQQCTLQFHSHHQQDCIPNQLMQDYISENYLNRITKTLEIFNKGVLQLIMPISKNIIYKFVQNNSLTEQGISHLKKMCNIQKLMENLTKQAEELSQHLEQAFDSHLKEKDNEILQLRNKLNELQENATQLQNTVNLATSKIKIKEIKFETTIEQYNTLLTELEKENQIFSDKDFPPNAQSIGFDYNDQAWARASEFCQGMKFFCSDHGPNVFGENGQVKQDDIVQGTIGNDSLYGIIYLLANHCPKLLEQNFITKKVSKNSIYAVKLHKDEEEKIIVVDDYLPYNWDYLLHIKLLGKDYSIWIGILEKAMAKLFGSYHQFGHLTNNDLIKTLINVPFKRLNPEDEQFFDNIQFEINLNSFIFVDSSQQNNLGLDPMNFYQIIGIKEFYHPDLKEIKLLELKCPWGGRQWKGDWSATSPLLNPELKKQMKYDIPDNGVFYMDQLSFMQHFLSVKCFRLNTNKIASTLISCRKKHAAYCKVRVHEPQSYFIQLKRVQQRDIHVIHKIVVISCQNNEYNFETCYMQDHLDTDVCVNLRKGTYILYVKVLWDHQETEDLSLRIKGQFLVEIAEIQKIPNLLRIVFDKQAQFQCQQKKIVQQNPLQSFKLELDGWAVFIVQNTSEKQISLRFQCKLENAKLAKPHTGDNFKQQLPPKSYLTILVKRYFSSVIQISPQITNE